MIYPALFVSMCMFVNELGPNKIKMKILLTSFDFLFIS